MIITTDGEIFSKELIASSAVARNSPTWGGFRPELEIIGKEANSLAWPNSVFPEPMMRKKPTGTRDVQELIQAAIDAGMRWMIRDDQARV